MDGITNGVEYLLYAVAVRQPSLFEEGERFSGGMLALDEQALLRVQRLLAKCDRAESSVRLKDAEGKVNSRFNHWQITYCENTHSTWYHAEDRDGTQFDRAKLEDVIELCRIFNGQRPPWR